jgi:hypothetical protein
VAAKSKSNQGVPDCLREDYVAANLRYVWAKSEMARKKQMVSESDRQELANFLREARAERIKAIRALKAAKSATG